jgi:hypothetical protein
MGKIVKKDSKGYTVKDDKSGKMHTFVYHDRIKARKFLQKVGEEMQEGKGTDIFQKYSKVISRLSSKEQDEILDALYTMNTQSGGKTKEAHSKVKELLNLDYTPEGDNIQEKVEYAEYKFRNKRDAQKALDYFKSQQLIDLNINDDGLSQGELAIDAGKKDMTKQHKEVLKMLKPKVLTTESFNLNEGMSKLLSPAQQKGVLKKWNEPEGSTFAKDVYSNAKIANKKDFIVTSHSVKDGDYYLSLLGNAPEGKEDKPLTAANTNMNADIRKICKKWSTAGKTSPNPAGMCFLEIERELCDKKYNKFAAADTMVREVVWGMVEDIMGIKIKTA